MLANPLYAVVVEHAQIARLIIINEVSYHASLLLVLRHGLGLLQPIDDMADGIGITPICRPYHLVDTGIVLDQCRIESIGYRLPIIGRIMLKLLIVGFCFLLRHTIIEIAGRSCHQVLAISLIDTFGQYILVEDDREKLIHQLLDRFMIFQWQLARIHLTHSSS